MHRDPYRFDPEELKARFNPEGSPLRLQQLSMKEMLKVLDGICRKHDIPYWIASGTLLGCMLGTALIVYGVWQVSRPEEKKEA